MPQFTKEQQQAVDDRGQDILVSASAGSGKTTVLVERVMQEILAGTGVDQLLVVTFTKAAAQEMKARIKQVLEQQLESAADKRYLRQQLNRVDTANISTIDAFCLDVIHRFYYVIDIDPSFSVLTDETQAALLRERALREIEGEFLEAKDKDFIAFYDNFAGDRDADSAQGLLLDLYNFAMAKPDYRDWLKQLSQKYQVADNIITSALWQEQIKPYLSNTFASLNEKIGRLLASSQIETKELSKVHESFTQFHQALSNYRQSLAADDDYETQRTYLRSCVFTGNYRKSNKWDEDLLDAYQESQALKEEAKNQVFSTYTSFYVTDESEQLDLLKQGQKITSAITKAELALIDRFNQLKRAENLLDYSDMEQLAYQILSQDTSNSQLARDFYRNKFKEILIDEYQDINALQEKILQLLKKDGQNNLFMVGDVKQSIYGFRQAEPSLFLHKYHAAAQAENTSQERILLSANFRSTKPVVKLVNQVFDSVLSTDFGGIDYPSEGQLVFGAQYYPVNLPTASEFLYHEKETQQNHSDETEPEIDASEITMVINRILQFKQENLQVYDAHLGHQRPFKYSDIAVLTRSRSDNLTIMQEFAKNHLPLFITDAKNYFQTLELTVIMNYLKIIDNPDQDIPLVAVLRSPLFNFKEPDLAKIRIHSKNTSFYDALTSYVTVGDQLSVQIKAFLNQLDNLRQFATNHRISELIWSIYERTSLLEIMTGLPNGEQRRVNLEALYERASSYESAGFKGLYQFINFIERMRRSQKDLAQPLLTKEAGDAVRLMTVHGSKGLEFPIVFYVGLQHRFQMRDLSGNYIINADNIGLTLRRKHYRADSLVKAIDNIKQKQQLLEEEARILYVGLTRAKQKLILVADIPSFPKKVLTWEHQLNDNGQLALADKLTATSPMNFIGPAIHFDKQPVQKISDVTSELDQNQDLLIIKYDNEKIAGAALQEDHQEETQNLSLLNQIAQKLYDFVYPFKDASQTTAYQAVSEIKKAFNDPIDTDLENAHLLSSTNRYLQLIDTKPNFLFESKFTGAEVGTATHLILQYYDYRGSGDDAQLATEIQELVKQKKLNPQIVTSLKKDEINWFVHSDFARDFWQQPGNLKREVDFSSLIAATTLFNQFSDPDAKILIHGTIDGYFEADDGIILFDYKTDHVDPNNLDTAIAKIKQKYTGQLRLYEQALNSFAKQKVTHKYLILLDAKRAVEVK
ncbi:helicase-exonuclease AddAB subunit AddA [Lactobacillus sp. ESL0677]|uniref:helicase-exonuclease AddAB subunit AddA n=1 Tax=Lactobacillus sp. ESL0677 TaxID=2983208 RepID=UPI0023F75CEF|nr:helicase-exonuclease AddAB subunit AddA [Lactobacillus sp. ESL0677]WEV36097.1 helicase-exonuclease AddAB subunit AddA [Lactobacillus sp. ESL0677]